MANPVLVELTRGGRVESWHRGAVAIADASGRLIWSAGDIDQPVFARSALKMLQALPLVESGAADAFNVSPPELALACASHSGEPFHVDAVAAWLERIGCDEADLACGAHVPGNAVAAQTLLREGAMPCRLHNNCSGKHAGFLTVARRLGVDTRGYEQPDHPVQRLALGAIAEMCGLDAAALPIGVDGCTAPAAATPLSALAAAMGRIADPSSLAPARAEAARRLYAAVRANPLYVAGTGRACTALIEAAGGKATVKTGAEGAFVAVLGELGLGVALKIDDGAGRASETAVAAILASLRVVDGADPAVQALAEAEVLDTTGRVVGARRPSPWLAAELTGAVSAIIAAA
ncbi:MAG TPA: asparaginase [Caulobacteraceae bacterium]|jgi:L-asparaginase II|nr:asparaginase [Caulobacteraceae bacterium]